MPKLARIVSLLQVVDVDRSIAFYERLGFHVANRIEDQGKSGWAWLDNDKVSLMVGAAEKPPTVGEQVMFYVYGENVAAMHAELEAAGVAVGPITTPFYAPQGEFRVEDPDGYVLMFTHDD